MTSSKWWKEVPWTHTDFLNSLDNSGSIKFTYEVKENGILPFLDLRLVRTDSGKIKLQIYRKPTHTDQ